MQNVVTDLVEVKVLKICTLDLRGRALVLLLDFVICRSVGVYALSIIQRFASEAVSDVSVNFIKVEIVVVSTFNLAAGLSFKQLYIFWLMVMLVVELIDKTFAVFSIFKNESIRQEFEVGIIGLGVAAAACFVMKISAGHLPKHR